ncbi:MAG: UvrB/UvrC motif-containing protein [Pirellulales bacterium]|jgi:protein arginine kinase activator
MKCQQCDKSAVFHITELEEGDVREVHLCEDHARGYLTQSDGDGGEEGKDKPTVGGMLAGPLSIAKTADDLSAIDQKACTMCGITFFEFRNNGRLGCPHDYVQFEKELEPLIANIHGATEHVGRKPTCFAAGTESLTAAVGKRREMKEAIECEEYEKAGSLRDELRTIDEAARGVVASTLLLGGEPAPPAASDDRGAAGPADAEPGEAGNATST